jgi:polysaccharide export outer membrane protein
MKRFSIYLFFILVSISSCTTYKDLIYLQEINANDTSSIKTYPQISIQPYDMLSIVVSSKNPELAFPFNLPVLSNYSETNLPKSLNSQRILTYAVDKEGYIDFPILGKLSVGGLTKEQLVSLIKERLISESYINDPIVTVQYVNFQIHLLGEVNNPGSYTIENEYPSILEALAMANDISIYGDRKTVKVIREKNQERIIYIINLTSSQLFESPAYYLQQNDIIIVGPNTWKKRQSKRNR